MKRVQQLMVVVLASGLMLGGCANTVKKEELAEVRALAEQASAQAVEARSMAADAKTAAADAKAEANSAATMAADAQTRSEETEAKIDRMFKKSMYK